MNTFHYKQLQQRAIEYLSRFRETPDTSFPSTIHIGIYLTIICLLAGLSLKNYHSIQLGTPGDDADYVVLARSLVQSEAYGITHAPGPPQPSRFPFGFPVLLSLFAIFFPDSPDTMKFISLIATLCNISLLFWGWPLFSRNQSYWWSILMIAFYGFSPITIDYTRQVMSEPTFTTFVLFSLLLAQFCITNPAHKKYFFILGGLTCFTYCIRIIGMTLGIALIGCCVLLYKHQAVKFVTYMLLGAVFLLSMLIIFYPIPLSNLLPSVYLKQLHEPHSYGQENIDNSLASRLVSSFEEYMTHHLRISVLPIGGGNREITFGKHLGIPNLSAITSVLVASFILAGAVSSGRRQNLSLPVMCFVGCYFGVILFWPWREARFLYPIQPFLCYYFVQGIYRISLKLWQRSGVNIDSPGNLAKIEVTSISFVIILIFLYRGVTEKRNSLDYMPRNFGAETAWIKQNTPLKSLIAAQNPVTIYLYSQRKTIQYPLVSNKHELLKFFHQYSVSYLLITPKKEWRVDGVLSYDLYTQETLLPLIHHLEQGEYIQLLYHNDEHKVRVYKILNGNI